MKKTISLFLIVCVLLCFVACDKSQTNSNQNNNNSSQSAQQATQKPADTDTHFHSYTSKVTKQANCGQTGNITYTCSCGDSYNEFVDRIGYCDWKYATCTKPDTCKVCGTTRGVAKGHNYSSSTGKCYTCDELDPAVSAKLKKCSLTLPSLPKSVSYIGSKVISTVKVTNITYEVEYYNDYPEITVYFSGEKTYDYQGSGQSDSCYIGWKLYDADGAVIEDGTFYSPALKVGEKFSKKEEKILSYSDKGDFSKYRLEILDVN